MLFRTSLASALLLKSYWFTQTWAYRAGDAISQEEIDTVMKILVPINTPLMFVADPDGNSIEVQNQQGSEVF